MIRVHNTDGITLNKPFEFGKIGLEYYPIPEDKTTGLINWHNAQNGFHVCQNCKCEFKFKDFKIHQC